MFTDDSIHKFHTVRITGSNNNRLADSAPSCIGYSDSYEVESISFQLLYSVAGGRNTTTTAGGGATIITTADYSPHHL